MFMLRLAIAFSMLLTFASTFGLAAQSNERSATLETIVSKLDAISRRIESLEQQVSRLEAMLVSRPEPEIFRTVGPYRIDKNGFFMMRKGIRLVYGTSTGANYSRRQHRRVARSLLSSARLLS
jgi:hypothetical protein